ncbi:MAG: hypothetical protein ACK5GV_09795, partial [Bacteroidota bacterium]
TPTLAFLLRMSSAFGARHAEEKLVSESNGKKITQSKLPATRLPDTSGRKTANEKNSCTSRKGEDEALTFLVTFWVKPKT